MEKNPDWPPSGGGVVTTGVGVGNGSSVVTGTVVVVVSTAGRVWITGVSFWAYTMPVTAPAMRRRVNRVRENLMVENLRFLRIENCRFLISKTSGLHNISGYLMLV